MTYVTVRYSRNDSYSSAVIRPKEVRLRCRVELTRGSKRGPDEPGQVHGEGSVMARVGNLMGHDPLVEYRQSSVEAVRCAVEI